MRSPGDIKFHPLPRWIWLEEDNPLWCVWRESQAYHSILNAFPGQLLSELDIVTRQLFNANWSYISKRRIDAILADNDRNNNKRLENFYNPGDHVMLWVPSQFRFKIYAVTKGISMYECIRRIHTCWFS